MLPKPTTGGSKTRNLGFGTPHGSRRPTTAPGRSPTGERQPVNG